MAPQATLTPLTDQGVVLITVTGATAPVSATATPAGGTRAPYTVRGPWYESPAGVWNTRDGDLPLNTDVQYDVRDGSGATVTAGVTRIASNDPILSSALDNQYALPVTVVSQKPNTWEGRTRWWDVLGRRDPFVSQAPLRLRGGDLLLSTDPAGRRPVLDLLSSGAPLLLRSTRPDAVDDVFMAVETVREELHNADAPVGHSVFALTYQAVSQELGPFIAAGDRTYTTVKGEAPTYDALRYMFLDYVHMRTGQRRGP